MQLCAAVVFAVQAPLLGPRVFGLIAIVWVFITFCEAMLDTATESLISVHRIEHRHYDTMNAVVVLMGGAVGAGLVLTSGAVAAWFGQPALGAVIRAMAFLPLLTGLGSSPNAATKRDGEFKPLAVRMIAGVTCGGVAGIALAVLGAGIWALVWQALIQRLVCLAVLWHSSALRPRVSLSLDHWRHLSVFVWPLLVAKVMAWATAQLPRFVLALHLTVVDLGLYTMAARLVDIAVSTTAVPRAAVARVALRRYAVDASKLDVAVAQFIRGMSLLAFPVCFGGSALAPTLIHAWLNPKWFGAIVPAQVLLLAAGAWVTFYGAGAVFLALGKQGNEAFMSAVQTATIAIVAWYFSSYGLITVALALAVRPLLLIPLATALVRRNCQVAVRAFLGGQAIPLCAAAGSSAAVWLIRDRTAALLGNITGLVVLGVGGLALYALMIHLLAPDTLRQLLPKARLQA